MRPPRLPRGALPAPASHAPGPDWWPHRRPATAGPGSAGPPRGHPPRVSELRPAAPRPRQVAGQTNVCLHTERHRKTRILRPPSRPALRPVLRRGHGPGAATVLAMDVVLGQGCHGIPRGGWGGSGRWPATQLLGQPVGGTSWLGVGGRAWACPLPPQGLCGEGTASRCQLVMRTTGKTGLAEGKVASLLSVSGCWALGRPLRSAAEQDPSPRSEAGRPQGRPLHPWAPRGDVTLAGAVQSAQVSEAAAGMAGHLTLEPVP